MNKQTQEKISKIKKCIENKEDLKEIEKKFFSTKKKKQEFLDRTYTYFDPKDLDYLEYIHKIYGKISEFKPINEKKEEVKSIEEVEEKQDLESKEKEKEIAVAEIVSTITDNKSTITESKEEITSSKQPLTVSDSTNTVSNQLLTNYFKDKENVEILIQLIEEHKKKSYSILDNEEIEIPSEVIKLKNTGGINVKANIEQYQVIKDMAQKNNVPIATFMNYVIWYFIKSHS
ncbi:hypothetical protein [Fusobacterium periodonticum]|uniref:hypothetical protein n=1 Tax=Fusobacterium periodonticum TaxID=860 RepID=UPI001959ED63|nr:hypothetical protein [Fusobacterium periodonticum]VTX90570.1 Uncharacterised protein [Fusobacterium periodonticum]